MSEKVTFIPCVKWVRKGLGKVKSETENFVELTSASKMHLLEKEVHKHIKPEDNDLTSHDAGIVDDEFDFEHYDDDENSVGTVNPNTPKSLKDSVIPTTLSVFLSNKDDNYITVQDSEDEDSELEDDVIKPKDNLILVGHVDGDHSILEVYVYNEKEDSLYVHHDITLPSIPLCLEIVSRNDINLVAVGSMEPVIALWDFEITNSVKPTFKLGSKAKKKKKNNLVSHSDAVLDISFNSNMPHILSSGSADHTVILWDMETKYAARVLKYFNEKVQSLQWHPEHPSILLTGCCDSYVRACDCRGDKVQQWELTGEIERVLWNQFNDNYFVVGTSVGIIYCIDSRMKKPLWSVESHTKEVSGLAFSALCPGMLFTAGAEGILKAWDVRLPEPVCIFEKRLKIGTVHCLETNPDLPFVVCAGGDNKSHYFGVWDIMSTDNVIQKGFSVYPSVGSKSSGLDEEMDTSTTTAFQSMSLQQNK